ncbi:MAG: uroporphyrinogen decarboxylase [Saprospiraceae bacterium]|nr:uroporphyrinogen decarboxylase [Saprospiraceae bacterium]
MLQNDLLLRTLRGERTERPPVWLMRQAGRILPEYRKIRSEVSGFKELVSSPQLAAEVTIQPVDILDVDAAIIFSDILVIPEAMGLDYELVEKVGPRFPRTIKSKQDVSALITGTAAAEQLDYVYQAVSLTKKELKDRVPLIGFAGAPFTLLAYMVEGKGSKTFSTARRLLYSDPQLAHTLLQKITETVISYLKQKVRAGVNVLQLFDSWSGVLDRKLYSEFGLRYIRQIVESVDDVPMIVFAKGAWFAQADFIDLKCALGIDWQTAPANARKIFGTDRVLQGNLDPACLLGDRERVSSDTRMMLEQFGPHHIANLGHGVYPMTPLENVHAFIAAVKSYRY